MSAYEKEVKELQDTVARLRENAGRSRSNGYALEALQREIDLMINEIQAAQQATGWLPGIVPPELVMLKHLRLIAHADHASDLFGGGPRGIADQLPAPVLLAVKP